MCLIQCDYQTGLVCIAESNSKSNAMMQQQQHPAITPLAPRTARNTQQYTATEDDFATLTCGCGMMTEKNSKHSNSNKENREGKTSQGLLAKMCSKILKTGRSGRRAEKCEKCGERSPTCRPNASFVSGRKHFLCESCRVSGSKMKNMFSQLSRNLSLRESRAATSRDSSEKSSSGGDGLTRSRSMRVRPQAPESGYETATSLDSSSCSNGRVSPDSVMSTDSAGHVGTALPPQIEDRLQPAPAAESKPCKDSGKAADVFGGAFTSEKDHFQALATKDRRMRCEKQPKVYSRQPQQKAKKEEKKGNVLMQNYDGYLQVRVPNAEGVKYVFSQKDGQVQEEAREERPSPDAPKMCYRCRRHSEVAFRAPFQKGWLCEDCMDDLL